MPVLENASVREIKESTLEIAWIDITLDAMGDGGYSPVLGSYGLNFSIPLYILLKIH